MNAAQHTVDQLRAAGRAVIADIEINLLAGQIAHELSTAVFRAALDAGLPWHQVEAIVEPNPTFPL